MTLTFVWHCHTLQFLPHGEPVTANERYVITTLECPRCKTKQKVHVSTSSGGVQVGDQTIPCIQCDLDFNVTVPDKIIRGPFPA
jgi:transcription elongation factor Elf1